LFRFLVKRTLENPDDPPRELEIAMKVFGRPPEFDSRMDSTVRVQASRLRAKLAEYYAGPGIDDPIIIEIPKGGYLAKFSERTPLPETTPPQPPGNRESRMNPAAWFVAGLLCGVLLGWTASTWSHARVFRRLPRAASVTTSH
jgi:hypothetical protein